MKELNLPKYSHRIIRKGESEVIFDPLRKKYVRLTPEEWVRQNFIQYLMDKGKYPPGLMAVEHFFTYNNLKRRADILVHNRRGEPVMIVECKSDDKKLDDEVFDQVECYNRRFKVPYLILTNGMANRAARFNENLGKYEELDYIPLYEDLLISMEE